MNMDKQAHTFHLKTHVLILVLHRFHSETSQPWSLLDIRDAHDSSYMPSELNFCICAVQGNLDEVPTVKWVQFVALLCCGHLIASYLSFSIGLRNKGSYLVFCLDQFLCSHVSANYATEKCGPK